MGTPMQDGQATAVKEPHPGEEAILSNLEALLGDPDYDPLLDSAIADPVHDLRFPHWEFDAFFLREIRRAWGERTRTRHVTSVLSFVRDMRSLARQHSRERDLKLTKDSALPFWEERITELREVADRIRRANKKLAKSERIERACRALVADVDRLKRRVFLGRALVEIGSAIQSLEVASHPSERLELLEEILQRYQIIQLQKTIPSNFENAVTDLRQRIRKLSEEHAEVLRATRQSTPSIPRRPAKKRKKTGSKT